MLGKNYANIALVAPIQISVMLVDDDKVCGPYLMRITAWGGIVRSDPCSQCKVIQQYSYFWGNVSYGAWISRRRAGTEYCLLQLENRIALAADGFRLIKSLRKATRHHGLEAESENTGTTKKNTKHRNNNKNTAESQHLKCAQSTKTTMRKRFRIFREACVGKETTSPHSIQHRKQSRRPLKGYLPHVKSDHSEAECFLPSTCPQFGYSSCDRMCCRELMRKKQSGQRSAHNFGQRPTI